MNDLFWHYFQKTGSIDAYMLYKDTEESLEQEEDSEDRLETIHSEEK